LRNRRQQEQSDERRNHHNDENEYAAAVLRATERHSDTIIKATVEVRNEADGQAPNRRLVC
jgi:hypothetical protein